MRGDIACYRYSEVVGDCEDLGDLVDTIVFYIGYIRSCVQQFVEERPYLQHIPPELTAYRLTSAQTTVLRRMLQIMAMLAKEHGLEKHATFYESLAKTIKTNQLKPITSWIYALDRAIDYAIELKTAIATKK